MNLRQVALIVGTAALLAGCASAAGASLSGAPAGGAGRAMAPLQAVSPAQGGAGGKSAASVNDLATSIVVGIPSADVERSVTAAYTVPPGAFLPAFEGVTARAVALGGYVVSSSTAPDSRGRIVSGAVTLKIPAPQLAAFLNGMPTTFVASSINFSSVDHTAQFVDVNARLASAHAHLAALDGLLAKAVSLVDITSLEQQIEQVQAEVDADQGELNVLTASVELATATVRLAERGQPAHPTAANNPLTGGIGGGWDNAVRITGAVLDGVVSVLPLLVLLAAGLLVWRRLARGSVFRRTSGAVD